MTCGLGLLADAGVELVELYMAQGDLQGADQLKSPLSKGAKPAKRGGSAVPTFDYTDPYAVERLGLALREAGLRLHSIHGPIFLGQATEGTENTGAERHGKRQRKAGPLPSVASRCLDGPLDTLVESLQACIDACAALGGRFVVTQDGLGEELGPESVERVPHLASPEPLSRLADYAARHGCVFAIENGSEDAARFSQLVETVARLDHPGLGICLDTGHAQVWNYRDVPRAVREAGGLLRTCHIHDNLGLSDDHLPPGDGVIPWGAVFEELGRAGYTGPLVLELHSDGGVRSSVEVADLLARSIEFLARFL